jgi:hypothetical protein
MSCAGRLVARSGRAVLAGMLAAACAVAAGGGTSWAVAGLVVGSGLDLRMPWIGAGRRVVHEVALGAVLGALAEATRRVF